MQGWQGFSHSGWTDLTAVRARLAAGANPDSGTYRLPPLHFAAEFGSAVVVAELATRVRDVDAAGDGRTALWRAVHARKPGNVKALLVSGADPGRPMMSGWSPARLSLTTPYPIATSETLTAEEEATVAEHERLTTALDGLPDDDGFSIACVAGIDAAEVARRLEAYVVPEVPEVFDRWAEPFGGDTELAVGVTDVPGGCVLYQPWYFAAAAPDVVSSLSAGTVAYGMYANPKSGNQGSVHRDGEMLAWDLHPGGGPSEAGSAAEVLLEHLYAHQAVAYCCAYAGLRPENTKAFTEPDQWIVLPALSCGHA
ncbi:hypothetical protein UK23_28880 [Lentzea aerocolonigenes]|uniref:Ankyrin n=2 Tax=Lentzea aerocolonigenes TaxID=68170 RepID=A0A0F0GMS6_LENAE|nr:hypothetical protein UK23_28880 [Lentzea aerocolonigenes]